MLNDLDLSKTSLKKFGRTMFVCLFALGAILFFRPKPGFNLLLFLAGVFLFSAQVLPVILKPVYLIWMSLAFCLGWINTRIILFIVYYFILTPIGLIMKLSGQDLLNARLEKQAPTYWIKRENINISPEKYERIF